MPTEKSEKKLKITRETVPTDVTAVSINIPEKEKEGKNVIGVEQTGTGRRIAEIIKDNGIGEYYRDFWNQIQNLGLEETPLKFKFKDGFVIDYVKDPDTGKELRGGKWEIPDMSDFEMKEAKTETKKKEGDVSVVDMSGYQKGGVVGGNPIKTDDAKTKEGMKDSAFGAVTPQKLRVSSSVQTSFAKGGMVDNTHKSDMGFPFPKMVKYPDELPKGKEPGQEGHATPKGKHGDVPKIKVSSSGTKQGFEKGGLVNARKMTGAQIQKEFGVDKPGDAATVYDCEIEDGRLKNATPNKEESARFSRIVSQMGTDRTGINTGNEQNQAALQYEDKPNVGVASGAGFCKGGKVKMAEGGEVPPEAQTAAPVSAEGTGAEIPAPAGAPESGGDMTGPFASYAKAEGVDTELVKRGDELFTHLDNAVSGGNVDEANRYLDELRQFITDVESARNDAVGKANDTSLAATYKEMANDARDLMSAFENIMKDVSSPESMAARQTPEPVETEA